MAAQIVDLIRTALAEGKIKEVARLIAVTEQNDKAVAKTKGFKEVKALAFDIGKTAQLSAGMSDEQISNRIRKAYQDRFETAGETPAKPKPTNAQELPDDVKASASSPAAPSATASPTRTTPPAASVSPANGSGRGKGALTGTRVTERLLGASEGKRTVNRSSVPLLGRAASGAGGASSSLTPAAAALVDDMARTARTGIPLPATGRLAQTAARTIQQQLLSSAGPLDPAAITTPATQLGRGARMAGAGGAAPTIPTPPPTLPNAAPSRIPPAMQTMPPQQLLQGLAPRGASLAAATNPLMAAQAQQMEALNAIAGEADNIGNNVRGRVSSRIPGIAAPLSMQTAEGGLAPLKARMAASGGLGGAAARGFGGLALSGIANEYAINPLEKSGALDPRAAGGLRGAGTGAAIGAALGAPLAGVGAVPGALLGAGAGALIGVLTGGGGGSKGNFDEASIMAFPGLSDEDKNALVMEYRASVAAGIPKKEVEAGMRQKALQVFQSSQQRAQEFERVLPNIMALQGLTAQYARPFYDDFRAANDQQRAMAQSSIASLPENQRAAAGNFAEQQYAQGNQTAAAFGMSNLMSPAFFLQDALRQNMASSGTPPAAGLGLSGAMGTLGGGGAAPDLRQLLAASGG